MTNITTRNEFLKLNPVRGTEYNQYVLDAYGRLDVQTTDTDGNTLRVSSDGVVEFSTGVVVNNTYRGKRTAWRPFGYADTALEYGRDPGVRL